MGFLERDMTDAPTITEYFRGKTIFITGGSGFMGKALIEKLLYSCSDLDRIYILLRSKRGVKSEDRLSKVYESFCFDRLRAEKPNIFMEKVFIVSGDVMEPGLGLSQEDRALLVNRVNIIFHVAASVRFDDSLAFAAGMNLGGTKKLIDFAKEVRDLSALIHVSTSYSNCNRNVIEEKIYPPYADWRDTLQICDELDDHTLQTLTPKYIDSIPNTYAFTKQLAEHVVYEQKGLLPAVIARPSIVISSLKEPMPGWLDNFNGPVGLMIASGKGLLRSLHTDPDLIADYIPVDIAIKTIICMAWMRGTKELEITDDIPIYNCCAGTLNNITMAEMVEFGRKLVHVMPINDALWSVGGSITTSPTKHYLKVLFLHCLPAILVDTVLWLLGKKPMLLKVQRRIYIANMALRYFITKQWTFINNNIVELRSCIKKEDHGHFYYDMETVDKHMYFRDCCIGGKKYLLREKEEDLPKAKAHYQRMVILDKAVQMFFYGYIFWWTMNTDVVRGWFNTAQDILAYHNDFEYY